jgi:Flp pilus assembly protein TadD
LAASREVSADALLARQTVLLAKMLERPADLDIAFEYATVSVMVGDYEAAISTFERMLIFAPHLPRVKLELGVLYTVWDRLKRRATIFSRRWKRLMCRKRSSTG